jgi:hypothetical protein
MRQLLELHEEINEVNFFLREWQNMKIHKDMVSTVLAEPEMRFISRTLERLIYDAQSFELPLILNINEPNTTAGPSGGSVIRLTECLKLKNVDGGIISYVGNSNGLLSIGRIAELVSRGGNLQLLS